MDPLQLTDRGGGDAYISDATHGEGGNAHFHFLPPMVKDPSHSGIFNPHLQPSIVLCKRNGLACEGAEDTVTFASGAIQVSTVDEHYLYLWDTSASTIASTGDTVRIRVYGGFTASGGPNALLGYGDVALAATGGVAKSLKSDSTFALVDGSKLPLKFRIEQGAISWAVAVEANPEQTPEPCTDCVEVFVSADNPDTVVITTPSAHYGVQIEPGTFKEDVTVSLDGEDTTPADPCIPNTALAGGRQVPGCLVAHAVPYQQNGFLKTVLTTVCITRRAGVDRHAYDLYQYAEERSNLGAVRQETVPGYVPGVDCSGFVASANLPAPLQLAQEGLHRLARWLVPFASAGDYESTKLGNFSSIVWAINYQSEMVPGVDGTSASPSGVAYPQIRITEEHHQHQTTSTGTDTTVYDTVPSVGAAVQFSVLEGGGALAVTVDTTDANGIAEATWTLGTSGTQVVRAVGPDSVPRTFTVTLVAPGQITDLTGDGSGLDLASGSAAVVNDSLRLRVVYAGTFDPDSTTTFWVLDVDQNSATGSPGVDSGTTDDTLIGNDYQVQINGIAFAPRVQLWHFTSSSSSHQALSVAVTQHADGYEVAIPLSALGNDDGMMNFKVVTSRQLGTGSWTGILDYMTDPGQPVGQTSVAATGPS